ncbi:AcvB/VirJ family lysyl-phosphatidylglycerol hydrolase [Sphingobium cupriresistens]|uniref:Type IV secretion system protein VirJ n=1 Tax=Sphingobium cupriresistens TaxID=1132417 RepID=A0A8G1ZFE4_9SPHN|nr:AcvB/VirJ family lysyl-phosphatidylglycerol hydrolase [Sphingobium cupriresistens]RYM09927.1 type IV secretion system protein VirJ [Sphingobium cupriresistens]
MQIPRQRTKVQNGINRSTAAVTGLIGALLLALWHIGYIGDGALFDLLPAKAASSPRQPRMVALYLSGDMGFHAGLGPRIADRLTRRGIPVVTENSLRFFRTHRTPEEAGAMIAQGLRRAIAVDPGARLLLLGQSFGADIIAPSLPYVPTTLRRQIVFIGLIAPGATRQWRASPSDILSFNEPKEDATTAARRLSWAPLLCIHRAKDAASLCPTLRQPNVTRLRLPRGHALDHDADAVSAALLQAIAQLVGGRDNMMPSIRAPTPSMALSDGAPIRRDARRSGR